jgi:hypothetical protein
MDKFQYAGPSAATNDVTLNNIHATLVLDDIRNKMDSYIGHDIGTDEQMADTERKIQACVYDRVRSIDPDAIVNISMPRADDGGHSAYLSITTRHPDRFVYLTEGPGTESVANDDTYRQQENFGD